MGKSMWVSSCHPKANRMNQKGRDDFYSHKKSIISGQQQGVLGQNEERFVAGREKRKRKVR